MTTHKQTREPHGPEIQIPLGQPPNMCLEILRHVVIVVALVAQGAHEIEHFGARVLALFAEAVFEVLGEEFEEVHLWADHFGS